MKKNLIKFSIMSVPPYKHDFKTNEFVEKTWDYDEWYKENEITMIGIVDYGCGNIQSLKNALTEIDVDFKIVSTPNDIYKFSKIIIPGVGSYSNAMKKVKDRGFEKKLKTLFQKKYTWNMCWDANIIYSRV